MINKLREKRAGLIANARTLLDVASAETRVLTTDEETRYASIMAEVDAIGAQIQREERLSGLETELRSSTGRVSGRETATETPDEHRQAFRTYLRTGETRGNGLNVTTAAEGGALVPNEFVSELFTALANVNVMRQIARVLPPVNGNATIPSFAPTGSAAWVAEEGTVTAQTPGGFAKNQINAYKAVSLIKVSEELLQDSAIDVESLLNDEFARQIGDLEESGFVAGDGSGKPTGVISGAATGKTTASTTAVTADEILDFFHSLKPQYRAKAQFLMNDTTALAVRKLKDSQGQYVWQPGLQAGQPDRLLGRPVNYSASMPTIATGAKVVAFGDFSQYVIVDRKEVSVQRLNELYAASGQVGFKLFRRTDGKLLVPEAVKLLVMA